MFYAFTRHIETVGDVIRAAGGTLSYVEIDSICGLFGLRSELKRAAEQALRAGMMIEDALLDLRRSLGDDYAPKIDIAISVHTGPSVVGEISSPEGPMVIALGPAIDGANALRKVATQSKVQGMSFAVSAAAYKSAAIEPDIANCKTIRIFDHDEAFACKSLAFLRHALPPVPAATWPSALRRFWAG